MKVAMKSTKKLPGILVDKDLNLNEHITNI